MQTSHWSPPRPIAHATMNLLLGCVSVSLGWVCTVGALMFLVLNPIPACIMFFAVWSDVLSSHILAFSQVSVSCGAKSMFLSASRWSISVFAFCCSASDRSSVADLCVWILLVSLNYCARGFRNNSVNKNNPWVCFLKPGVWICVCLSVESSCSSLCSPSVDWITVRRRSVKLSKVVLVGNILCSGVKRTTRGILSVIRMVLVLKNSQ